MVYPPSFLHLLVLLCILVIILVVIIIIIPMLESKSTNTTIIYCIQIPTSIRVVLWDFFSRMHMWNVTNILFFTWKKKSQILETHGPKQKTLGPFLMEKKLAGWQCLWCRISWKAASSKGPKLFCSRQIRWVLGFLGKETTPLTPLLP